VDEFPAGVLLDVFLHVDLVVPTIRTPTTRSRDLAMSLWSALRKIIATIPVRKMSMTAELTRLNQWIRGSNTWRYLSQRVAHLVDEY
jgi:hypothetical protein